MSLVPLVEETIKMLVADPDAVKVDETNDRGTLVYTVSVAPSDVGRVIGKDGRVISSVRQLVGAAGAKSRFKTVVKVASDN
ncbi:MAG: KH domain-containing protein [Armatimonadota bacterium]